MNFYGKMSDPRVKEGELLKYRNVMYGWKKYYFRLERSYLHYLEGKYNAEPKGTITRGEIAQVKFTKDYQSNFGFEIHLKNGYMWHLKAASHEERMEWMRALLPDAYIDDPLKTESPVCNKPTASAPPESHLPDQQQFSDPNYHRIYPHLSGHGGSSIVPEGYPSAPLPDSPPPAYDEINN